MHVRSIDLQAFANIREEMAIERSHDFGPVLVHLGMHPRFGATVLVQDISGCSAMTENALAR